MLTRRDCLRSVAATALAATGALSIPRARAAAAPSGRLFACVQYHDEGGPLSSGIFAIDPADGTWRKVLDEGMFTARVSWDGKWLAFARSYDLEKAERGTWLAPVEGDEPLRRVSEAVGRPSWSPDGRHIVISGTGFQEPDSIVDGVYEAWRVGVDGSEPERLPLSQNDLVVDWSRDGDWLLVTSPRGRPAEAEASPLNDAVYLVRPDGRTERQAQPGGMGRWRHRFVAGGKRRQWLDPITGDESSIWTSDLDGKNAELLVAEHARQSPWDALVSPDGAFVATSYFGRSQTSTGSLIRDYRIEIKTA